MTKFFLLILVNTHCYRSSGSSLISNRRRVGRPRKNLDAVMNQCSSSSSNVEPNLLLAGTGDSDHASMLMPAPPLPCSESFTVYRRGGGGQWFIQCIGARAHNNTDGRII
jgi:hypothetical protein